MRGDWEEIRKPIGEFDIREMILQATPPQEWCGIENHPINQIGYYYFGIADGYKFYEDKVQECDEELLWKLYGLIQKYWCEFYSYHHSRYDGMAYNMRNNIIIKDEDVGKSMLAVYEEQFEWRF